jgi:ArsR family transcriptional regulator
MARNGRKSGDIDVIRASKLLKAVADEDRLRLLLQLKDGEKNVGRLAEELGEDIVNVSHHLGVLRVSGLVKDKKVGRFVYYKLNPDYVKQNGTALYVYLSGCTLIVNS